MKSIRRRTLRMILEAGKSTFPNEFAAVLRAEKGVITELLLLPGTESGGHSALFRLHMLPVDFSAVGTVHTHPSGVCLPSGVDLQLFAKFGWVHIIACNPFDDSSWACYDAAGIRRLLEVVR